MVIPKNPTKNVDEFVTGAKATAADQPKRERPGLKHPPRFLLEIDVEMRTQLKIESIQKQYPNVSEYICEILKRRDELQGI